MSAEHTLEYLVTTLGVPFELVESIPFHDGVAFNPQMIDLYKYKISREIQLNTDRGISAPLPTSILEGMDGNFFAESPLKIRLHKKRRLTLEAEKEGYDSRHL